MLKLRWLVASDLLLVFYTSDIYATTYQLHAAYIQEESELPTSLDDVSTQHNLVNPAHSHSFLHGAEHHREAHLGRSSCVSMPYSMLCSMTL